MPDFTQLLGRPAGEAKAPAVLPPDDYPGIICGTGEPGESARQKTPFVRFPIRLTDWGPGTPETWEVYDATQNKMVTHSKEEIDLSKRQLRVDYYLTEDALFRLDEFIRSCGIDPEGRTYQEILPELVGKPVTVQVQQYTPQDGSMRVGNQVGRVVGQSAS